MGDGQAPLSVPDPKVDRIRRVPLELREELLGADLFLMLYVAPIPEDSDVRALPALAACGILCPFGSDPDGMAFVHCSTGVAALGSALFGTAAATASFAVALSTFGAGGGG